MMTLSMVILIVTRDNPLVELSDLGRRQCFQNMLKDLAISAVSLLLFMKKRVKVHRKEVK